MIKYKKSLNIEITPVSECEFDNIPAGYWSDHYVLYHQLKHRDYLINPTIKFFLDKFESPKTIIDVIEDIKNELKSNDAGIEKVCMDFFDFLVSRKIIVDENEVKKIVVDETVFNMGDHTSCFVIVEMIASRKDVELYKVVTKDTKEQSVLKVLNRKKTKNEQTFLYETGWLEREYEFLKRMHQIPELCNAFSFDKNDNYAFIQMEYIQGISLNRFLNNSIDLNLTNSLRLISAILKPFAALHKQKLIHGDIHSANILITDKTAVRIIDLGFSSVADLEKDEVLKSGGVTYYMPPERINTTSLKKYKRKSANLQSDVYQIGVLLYVTIYNKLPFKGFIWEELAENIQKGNTEFAAISYSDYTVPENLIGIIKKCLQISPEKRYEDAGNLFEDFNLHFSQNPVLTLS